MNKFFTLKQYQPRRKKEYYCSCCDRKVVDSTAPATGNFYLVGGSGYSSSMKDYSEENWELVLFAVCSECFGGD